MSLERRIEKRKQARNYKAQNISVILRSFQDAVSNIPAPIVHVAAPHVEVAPEIKLSPVINLEELTTELAKQLEDMGKTIQSEIAKPRKVVCDKDGEPIGTVQVESL